MDSNSMRPVKTKPQPIQDPLLSKKQSKRAIKQQEDCISVYCRVRPFEKEEEPNSCNILDY